MPILRASIKNREKTSVTPSFMTRSKKKKEYKNVMRLLVMPKTRTENNNFIFCNKLRKSMLNIGCVNEQVRI